MSNIPRERDFGAKKESSDEQPADHNSKFPKTIASSSSRQWSSLKNPRIVRVSRNFGGKDRHSKVYTLRGLRDRRIRLSVPTAVQLYDLQDRLGLGQPSKVVDWLLDATKHEIDKLAPLPIIPPNFAQFHQPTVLANSDHLGINQSKEVIKMNEKEAVVEKDKWIDVASQQEQENQDGFEGFVAQLSAHNFFPLTNQSSIQNMPNYNSNYFNWDDPNLSLSQFGGGYSFSFTTDQTDQEQSHSNLSPSSHLYFCPSAATTIPSSIVIPPFPSHISTPSMENDQSRQNITHLQNVQQNPLLPTTLNLISSAVKSFGLNINESKNVHSQENDTRKQDKYNKSS